MTPIEDLHNAYLLIAEMKIPIPRKVRLLSELFAESPNPWRVVGITEKALDVFKEHNFKKISKMGINRSHIINRNDTYTYMFNNIFKDPNKWWNYYFDKDKTILSTSSENTASKFSTITTFDNNNFLFKSRGFAWTHGKQEEQFLKELYAKQRNYRDRTPHY